MAITYKELKDIVASYFPEDKAEAWLIFDRRCIPGGSEEYMRDISLHKPSHNDFISADVRFERVLIVREVKP